jgi:hypothetical protein
MKNTNNLFGNGDKQEILVSRPCTALVGQGNVCRPARPRKYLLAGRALRC